MINDIVGKNTSLATLERVLREELHLYRQYAEILKKDDEAMKKLQVVELERNNKEKDTVLLKLQTLDQLRKNVIKQVALDLGITESGVRIQDICQKLNFVDSARIKALRDELHKVVSSLQTQQEMTKAIAQSSLSWINGGLATLRRLLTPDSLYGPRGKVDEAQTFSGRLVVKQV